MIKILRFIGKKDDHKIRKSNVQTLKFADNRRESYDEKSINSDAFRRSKSISQIVTEKIQKTLSPILSHKRKTRDGMDIDEKAIDSSSDCIESLKLLINQIGDDDELLINNNNNNGQYDRNLICDIIQDLGSIYDHIEITLRKELYNFAIYKSIQDAKYQQLIRLNEIETANNNHLMTDVIDDYVKTAKQSNKASQKLKQQHGLKRAATRFVFGNKEEREEININFNINQAIDSHYSDDYDSNQNISKFGSKFRKNLLENNLLEIDKVILYLHKLDTWDDVNIFDVHERTDGHTLLIYFPLMFERFGFIDNEHNDNGLSVDKNTLFSWLNCITNQGYNHIPYHSVVHAADVLQTAFYWVTRNESQVLSLLTNEDIFAMLIAATIHDYQHPGISHPYLIQSNHTSRYIYNDIDILENFHLCQAFKMMKQNDLDIFKNINKKQRRIIKKNIIGCVLATNFGHQNELIFDMRNDPKYIHGSGKDISELTPYQIYKTRSILRPLLLHASDISHCCKQKEIHLEWSERYFYEYYIEKEMLKTKGVLNSGIQRKNFPLEQCMFFELWCLPFYGMLLDWCDMPQAKYILETANQNYSYWKSGKGTTELKINRNF